jgi:hypothetical protein
MLKLIQTLINLGKVLLRSRFSLSLEESEDDRVIVLGNGPSLKNDILNHKEIFANSHLSVVNHFCHSEFFFELEPKSYFLLDPAFFNDTHTNKNVEEQVGKTMDILINQVNWEIHLYVPYRNRNARNLRILKEHKNFKIHYINYVPAKGGFRRINQWLYDRDLATPQCQNILVFTLFLQTRKETKEIFLFGAENSWHVDVRVNKENQLVFQDVHMYEERKEITERVLLGTSMADLLESSVKVFKAYAEIEDYSRKKNVQIYNCSKNSFIDSFKRLDDDEFNKMFMQ